MKSVSKFLALQSKSVTEARTWDRCNTELGTLAETWSDGTSHQSSTTRSAWFRVKKWRNRKIIFGTFIYVLWSYQNHENPVGDIDTLS